MKPTTLSIIIVNWNTKNQLRDCITSIVEADRHAFILQDVIVVDNGSTDSSMDDVELFDVPLKLIRNDKNLGFAAACNQGSAVAQGDYFLFLNPDTRLFKNSLTIPVAFLEKPRNNNVGICGIQLVDEEGVNCLSYKEFPSLKGFILQAFGVNRFLSKEDGGVACRDSDVLTVDQVIGAFFIVRKSLFDQLESFDERYFVYFEEVDLALSAYKKGWISTCLTDVKCVHIGGGSSSQVKAARLFYSLRSRILFGFKHFSLFSAIILFLITLTVEFVSRSFLAIIHKSWEDLDHVVEGYAMLIKDTPSILMKIRSHRVND